MKFVVLMENTAPEGACLSAEAGLALYIEYRGHKLLLDAGSSGKFADNAAVLGIDLSQVELAVLSHGHYDHSDGLRRFFAVNQRAKVYARTTAGGPYFSTSQGSPRFIGVHRDIWTALSSQMPSPSPWRGSSWSRRPSTAVPLPARRPICCGRWARTSLSPTTSPMSSPWCWRGSGGWWSLTPAPTGAS